MTSVLFVCLGNICRSPAAEAVMTKFAADAGLDLTIDSAGTSAYHAGERADERMRTHGEKRGFQLLSRSRQVTWADLKNFDLILAMDQSNYQGLQRLAGADAAAHKIKMFCQYCQAQTHDEVPDPYYGGAAGFELVYDILEDGCQGLVDQLQKR